MFNNINNMKNKILPLFLIFAIIITGGGIRKLIVQADNATTSVEVGNTVPVFTNGQEPHEDPASATSTPTNVDDNVTFKAKASDANGDDWKLLICKSGSVSGTSCATSEWCHSDFASSTTEATCSYTALVTDSETEAWYGFACDAVGCSAESHKTDDSGPPFHVNHRPAFTVFNDDSPKDPNVSVAWHSTSSDPDSGGADTVTLYVCKTASFSTSTGCAVEWCHSSASASDPTCSTTTPQPDGDYDSYGYVKDNHNFAASGGVQGTNSIMTVNNVAPTIDASSIHLLNTDGSGNLMLLDEQAETPNFKVTFIVTDNNSCMTTSSGAEIASAFINVRMSEKAAQSACDDSGDYNANDCYPDAYASWNPVCAASSTVDSCTGNTDTSVGWACTFPLQYHADPTVASTPKAAYNWIAAVQATDDNSANTGLVDSTTYSNEMDKFMSYDLASTTLAYGSVSPNADSLEKTTTVKATGNVGLDENLLGTQLCNDYPGCAGGDDIAIAQQNYSTSTPITWGGAGAVALLATSTEAELNCLKTTDTGIPATKDTYWMLRVPTGQAVGTYTGQNTIEGKVDNETYGG